MKYSEHALRIKKLADMMGTDGSSMSAPPAPALSTAPTPAGKFKGPDMMPGTANQAPPLENPDLMTAKAAADLQSPMSSPLGPNGPAFMRAAGKASAPAPTPVPRPAPAPVPAKAPTMKTPMNSDPFYSAQIKGAALIGRLVKGAGMLGESKGTPQEARDALSADFLGMGHPSDASDKVHPPLREPQDQLIAEAKGKVAGALPVLARLLGAVKSTQG